MTLSLIVLLVTALLVAVASWATAWHMVRSDRFADNGQTLAGHQDHAARGLVTADAR